MKKGGKYYQSKKFFGHEKFNEPNFANDIALILLDGEITFDDKVKLIELATATEDIPADTKLQLSKILF